MRETHHSQQRFGAFHAPYDRQMSIVVVCPGCRKSFKVSDKFAGKSGPCPNCKRTLQVPTKAEEVKVHAPEAFAGGGKQRRASSSPSPSPGSTPSSGRLRRLIIFAAVVAVLVAAGLGRPLWTAPGALGLWPR